MNGVLNFGHSPLTPLPKIQNGKRNLKIFKTIRVLALKRKGIFQLTFSSMRSSVEVKQNRIWVKNILLSAIKNSN